MADTSELTSPAVDPDQEVQDTVDQGQEVEVGAEVVEDRESQRENLHLATSVLFVRNSATGILAFIKVE